MRGLPSILSSFLNEFNTFNNTGARMLHCINHMKLSIINRIFSVRTASFCHLLRNVIMDVITSRYEICKPLVIYRFYCMALYHSQTRRYWIKFEYYKCKTVAKYYLRLQNLWAMSNKKSSLHNLLLLRRILCAPCIHTLLLKMGASYVGHVSYLHNMLPSWSNLISKQSDDFLL